MTLLFMPMLAFLPTVIINYLAPLSVFFFAVVVIFTNGNNQTIFIKNYSIHD